MSQHQQSTADKRPADTVIAMGLRVFTGLLDRSFARIAELSADGRFFDRTEVAEIADVWDNNTVPLFQAALARSARIRDRHAAEALQWMADLGPSRRAWMIRHGGQPLAALLGPASPDSPYYRDSLGRIRFSSAPLTVAAVTSLTQDYRLDQATLRTVRVERAGTTLDGYLAVQTTTDAVVQLYLRDIQDVRFDSSDTTGIVLAVDDTGVEIRIGDRGLIRCGGAVLGLDDDAWHLTHAGRAADAITPAREPKAPKPRVKEKPVGTAAYVLHEVMLQIRTVRYAKQVGKVPIREYCEAFAGAGDAILSAATRPWWSRDAAFGRLTDEWLAASPHLTNHMAKRYEFGTPTALPAEPVPPDRGVLTLASWTASQAIVNYALDDGSWRLWSADFEQPERMVLETSDFEYVSRLPENSGDIGKLRC
ncbi:hypothetical protein [Winogradskya humida]|uniref:Uncharacterized protein n=1 Tax=Winogradskya humida TaxID=113566 RepID=A0ABQ3ZED2_9ACTN|nr:hypothetical protein [Actinoplanes humidus]GIE16936.1 hypothetical protein Ahu01nite_000380 [Actinoplanes humidus]